MVVDFLHIILFCSFGLIFLALIFFLAGRYTLAWALSSVVLGLLLLVALITVPAPLPPAAKGSSAAVVKPA